MQRDHEDEPRAKRRKVRKVPTNTVCDNCVRRKTTCVSQEYVVDGPEYLSPKPTNGLDARLSRVEDLLERLVTQGGQPPRSGSIHRKCAEALEQSINVSVPFIDQNETPMLSSPRMLLTPPSTSQSPGTPLTDYHTGIARDLVTTWPPQNDLDHIYALPVGLATHLHMTTCFTSREQRPASSRDMLQLPPLGSHPVLIARKLLLLSSLLQGALSTSSMLAPNRTHFRRLMFRILDTVTRLVTTNDELTASVEGLECTMIETMIHNYSGNLQKAWMTSHRASALAQMLGLHRGSRSASLKFIDQATRDHFDFEHVGFVLENVDSYLSVTLGLPKSSFKTVALSPEALAERTPLQRLVRLQCVVADRILDRKAGKMADELLELHQIDELLHGAAAQMPPQWWLIPDFEAKADAAADSFQHHARVNLQLTHYHLIVRLHLPYLLRPLQDATHDNNKFTVINTSRDILTLYIAFRKWNTGRFYCRGIDYLIFIAVTTLCVAHVSVRRSHKAPQPSGSVVDRFLMQNRLRDRGLMERTLQILQDMEDDAIAAKLSHILQHLLVVEADSFSGTEYNTTIIENEVAAAGCEGNFVDSWKTYQLRMPYFGTINLQPTNTPNTRSQHSAPTDPADTSVFYNQAIGTGNESSLEDSNQWSQQPQLSYGDLQTDGYDQQTFQRLDAPDNWTLQSINDSLFDSLFRGLNEQDLLFGMPPQ